MGTSSGHRLEKAVERLLEHHAQLQDQCARLQAEQQQWQRQRRELLAEIEAVLADLAVLRERQA
jgi:hypothetical protein